MPTYTTRSTGLTHTLPELRTTFPNIYIPDNVSAQYLNDIGVDIIPDVLYSPTLAEAQAAAMSKIDIGYYFDSTAPIVFAGSTFQADKASCDMILDTISASGGTLPTGFGWWDITNTKVPVTFTDLQSLANAIFVRSASLFETKQAKKSLIRAATTLTEVDTIVW